MRGGKVTIESILVDRRVAEATDPASTALLRITVITPPSAPGFGFPRPVEGYYRLRATLRELPSGSSILAPISVKDRWLDYYGNPPVQFIRRWFARRRVSPAAFPCPHCGSEVPGGRQSCPNCGASDSDGWGEDPEESSSDWAGEASDGWGEDPDFDYDSFVEREFGERKLGERGEGHPSLKPDPKRLVLWIVILAFAATLLLPLLF